MVSGAPVSSRTSGEDIVFQLSALEHGHLAELYERGIEHVPREKLYPTVRLEHPDVRIPRGGIAVIHGVQDSVVSLRDVEKFVARAREVTKGLPGNEGVVLTVRDGDHGFDCNARFDEVWLQKAFEFAIENWL